MGQFIIGLVIFLFGSAIATVGGFIATDGWNKWHNPKKITQARTSHQGAPGNANIQATTTGDNSPIFIDNRKVVLSHRVQAKPLFYNKPEGDLFITKVELFSQHPIPNLYLAAYAKTIVEFNVIPQRSGLFMEGHSGRRDEFWFTNVPNFGGKYMMEIKTRKAEKIEIVYE